MNEAIKRLMDLLKINSKTCATITTKQGDVGWMFTINRNIYRINELKDSKRLVFLDVTAAGVMSLEETYAIIEKIDRNGYSTDDAGNYNI